MLEASLERIRAVEQSIQAWVEVNPQPATGEGPLSGIPFGAKDIIETANLPTEYGSDIYAGRRGLADAPIIRTLRGLGAILAGKTRTTPFAYLTPTVTRNPRNVNHTPGGSSSGSAAAVAAGMVPFALGSQTWGSVLRPASYCGVTGFKPTYGLFSLEGVLPLAHTLDTLGFFTETAADMLRLWQAMGRPAGTGEECAVGVPDPLPAVEESMAGAFRAAVSALPDVRPVKITPMLDRLVEESRVVMYYEGARFHEQRYREHGERLLDLAVLVREGLEIPDRRYRAALASIAESRERIAEVYRATPVIAVPAATGPAPAGLASTGDSRMNRPWTAMGTPAISIPMAAHKGLPLGLQLTAAPGEDALLLRAAVRIATVLPAVPPSPAGPPVEEAGRRV